MKISEILLPQFDEEIKSTRRVLERVPLDKPDWKPHDKSMSLVRLAGHVAELPTFISTIIRTENLELSTSNMKPFIPSSNAELLSNLEKNAEDTRSAICGASDANLGKHWSLTFHGKPVFEGTKSLLVPTTLGHLVHHRAQLTVYLRLLEVSVPGVYGPSADEMAQFAG
jgi:uncharacterized damage-inducible protein DinB